MGKRVKHNKILKDSVDRIATYFETVEDHTAYIMVVALQEYLKYGKVKNERRPKAVSNS